MRKDLYYNSCAAGQIHACRWEPEGTPVAVVQIVHGIAEHVLRYNDFANYLNQKGILVVAEDHMGHGASIGEEGLKGYFYGGWFSAVEDTYQLTKDTMRQLPNVPYFLFGHSMGSFMTRTLIAKYPDSGITGCIISGTAWQPVPLLAVAKSLSRAVCRKLGEKTPSEFLQNLMFGSYNKKIEHQRTVYDWLSRDERIVDAYIQDPDCGYMTCSGLLRDMLLGIDHIQKANTLNCMNKQLPVLFIAGGDDPVGNYGSGVQKTAKAFTQAGMQDVSVRIYPLCRHEILNEINKQEVYSDILNWIGCKL